MSFVFPKKEDKKEEKDLFLKDAFIEKRPQGRYNFLLLGSGGRESAIAWKLSQSNCLARLFIAPGNAGTEDFGINLPDLRISDFNAIVGKVKDLDIDYVVVGPEEPLVKGIADYFALHLPNVPVIGPSASAAKLEGSKEFSKAFMCRHQIPTARYRAFAPTEEEEAEAFLDSLEAPYVLKADGLAAGKGVIIAYSRHEAARALKTLFDGASVEDPKHVVIEEYLSGIECSVFIATDGKHYKLLPVAKDYKRIGDGDTGPNTGGMGAVSRVPFADEEFMAKVVNRIIEPTLQGLNKEGIIYRGFLFFGLMNCNGDPYVIEYNCRLGDPETQVILPRIESDLGEMILAISEGRLHEYELVEDPRYTIAIVLASLGYPGTYFKGYEINLPLPSETTMLFHAGTAMLDGKLVTNGGRVLAIVSYGKTPQEAACRSYTTATQVLFEGKNYRHDIGQDLFKNLQKRKE